MRWVFDHRHSSWPGRELGQQVQTMSYVGDDDDVRGVPSQPTRPIQVGSHLFP
jgi:urease beta subunit